MMCQGHIIVSKRRAKGASLREKFIPREIYPHRDADKYSSRGNFIGITYRYIIMAEACQNKILFFAFIAVYEKKVVHLHGE